MSNSVLPAIAAIAALKQRLIDQGALNRINQKHLPLDGNTRMDTTAAGGGV